DDEVEILGAVHHLKTPDHKVAAGRVLRNDVAEEAPVHASADVTPGHLGETLQVSPIDLRVVCGQIGVASDHRQEHVSAGLRNAHAEDFLVSRSGFDFVRTLAVVDLTYPWRTRNALRALRPLRSPRTLWPLRPLRSSLVPLNCFLSDLAGFDRGIDDPLASVRGVVAAVDDAVGVRNGREDDRWRRQANCGDERADRPEIETQN